MLTKYKHTQYYILTNASQIDAFACNAEGNWFLNIEQSMLLRSQAATVIRRSDTQYNSLHALALNKRLFFCSRAVGRNPALW